MHNKAQERNTDMLKAHLIQEASSELKEKLGDTQATLEEVKQRCQKLEKQNAETIDELRALILEKKAPACSRGGTLLLPHLM